MELKDFIKETISQIAESVNELNELMTSKLLLVCILPLLLTSCQAEIEPSAANSASAIIAVIGEYLFAIIVLLFCGIVHLMRIGGAFISTMALFLMYNGKNLWNLNSASFFLIGIALIACSLFIKIRPYTPQVLIAKNISKHKYKSNNGSKINNKKSIVREIVIGVITAVLSGIILSISGIN